MKEQIIRAVEIVGSQKALADKVGVKHQVVWAWINRNSMPCDYAAAIEKATNGKVTRKHLFPKEWKTIWPELASAK